MLSLSSLVSLSSKGLEGFLGAFVVAAQISVVVVSGLDFKAPTALKTGFTAQPGRRRLVSTLDAKGCFTHTTIDWPPARPISSANNHISSAFSPQKVPLATGQPPPLHQVTLAPKAILSGFDASHSCLHFSGSVVSALASSVINHSSAVFRLWALADIPWSTGLRVVVVVFLAISLYFFPIFSLRYISKEVHRRIRYHRSMLAGPAGQEHFLDMCDMIIFWSFPMISPLLLIPPCINIYLEAHNKPKLWAMYKDGTLHTPDLGLISWILRLRGSVVLRSFWDSFSPLEKLIITGPASTFVLVFVLHAVLAILLPLVKTVLSQLIRNHRMRTIALFALPLIWFYSLSTPSKRLMLHADHLGIYHQLRDVYWQLPSTWMRLQLCTAQWVKFGVVRGRRGPIWDSLPLGHQLIIITPVITDYIPALFQLVVRIKVKAHARRRGK
ncbi:hypothetical protein C8J57DRAFT_1627687 [Mycena rebaudengoi]|nr:hypothetical protein C8J57DRAFT_1627687 [Mycena rebaudengoi]